MVAPRTMRERSGGVEGRLDSVVAPNYRFNIFLHIIYQKNIFLNFLDMKKKN